MKLKEESGKAGLNLNIQGGGRGGSGRGTHVNPWLVHVNVWQNPLQYCKVISLQLMGKKREKKKKTSSYNPPPQKKTQKTKHSKN